MKNVMDLQKMLKSAKEIQDRLQKELADLRVDGSSGGGMVTVVLDGHKVLQSIRIDPEVVNRDEVEMLQDLIVAAFNDGAAKVDEALASKLGGLGAGLKILGLDVRIRPTAPRSHRGTAPHPRHRGQDGPAHRLLLPWPADRGHRPLGRGHPRGGKARSSTALRCNNITHVDPCPIRADEHRSDESLCIVEEPFNISSIERTGAYTAATTSSSAPCRRSRAAGLTSRASGS